MTALEIIIYDDPVLREKAKPIKRVAPRHAELAAGMTEAMFGAKGIGLAANQVGVTERLIVIDGDPEESKKNGKGRHARAMINPEVLEESKDDNVYEEGCLSLPDIRGDIWRPTRIRLRYQDLEGRVHEEEARDLVARCILHEIDHLDGVLIIDRMTPDARRKLAGKLRKLREARV